MVKKALARLLGLPQLEARISALEKPEPKQVLPEQPLAIPADIISEWLNGKK